MDGGGVGLWGRGSGGCRRRGMRLNFTLNINNKRILDAGQDHSVRRDGGANLLSLLMIREVYPQTLVYLGSFLYLAF